MHIGELYFELSDGHGFFLGIFLFSALLRKFFSLGAAIFQVKFLAVFSVVSTNEGI
jgi:hypothetical protein